MRLYNGGLIITGIVVFLALATFPFTYNIGKANAKPDIKLEPAIKKSEELFGKKQCVEPKEWMRREHMVLLNHWRDAVVRDENRGYLRKDTGARFNMSLQNECMQCHSSKKNFCDQCHNYIAVKPFCWDCHIAPTEKEEAGS